MEEKEDIVRGVQLMGEDGVHIRDLYKEKDFFYLVLKEELDLRRLALRLKKKYGGFVPGRKEMLIELDELERMGFFIIGTSSKQGNLHFHYLLHRKDKPLSSKYHIITPELYHPDLKIQYLYHTGRVRLMGPGASIKKIIYKNGKRYYKLENTNITEYESVNEGD